MGLWIGPTAACAYLTIAYNILIICLDWPKLFKEVRDRRDVQNATKERLDQEAKQAQDYAKTSDYIHRVDEKFNQIVDDNEQQPSN